MKKIVLLITLAISSTSLFSQRNFSLYQMKGIPQAIYINPAYVPVSKIYVSIPALSYINMGLSNSAFSFNDLMTRRADDSLEINTSNVVSKLKKLNALTLDVQNEIFGLGFKLNDSYFNFSVMARNKFEFLYPGDLIRLAVQGNADFLDKRISMDGLGINLSSYMEYNFGFARKIGDQFHVGGRVKFISGIANIDTRKTKLGIYTDPTTYALTIDGALDVRTANLANYFGDSSSNESIQNFAYNFKNKGLGLDLGGTFQMNEKVTLSASALDLGAISWSANTQNYEVKDFKYTFDGINLNQFFQDSSRTFNDAAKEVTDTLQELFEQEKKTESYATGLGSKFYIGASYQFTKSLSGSALVFSEVLDRKYIPGLTLSGNAVIKDWLVATVNYTMYNNSYANLGLGLSLRGGPIQFYFITDNVLGIIAPLSTKGIHFCAGMAVMIKQKDRKEKSKVKTVTGQGE